jgi:N-methylhydantoinase A
VLTEQVAAPLGLSVEQAAEGILRIATAGMARAIRSISTERGRDLRRFALFAYGGAGPIHAGDVARELGMPRVIIPVEPGTLCARGILHSDLSFDLVQTRIAIANVDAWRDITGGFAELSRAAGEVLDRERVPPADRRALHGVDARYEGQNFEVYVGLDGVQLDGDDPGAVHDEFTRRFRAAHTEIYGYDIPGRAIEVVTLRLKTIGTVPKPAFAAPPASGGGAPAIGLRPVYFDAATGWLDTPIHERAGLSPATPIPGPAIIEEMSATTLLHPGQSAVLDPAGNLIVTVFSDETPRSRTAGEGISLPQQRSKRP